MVDIPGLSAAVCEQLAGIQEGDLILVKFHPKPDYLIKQRDGYDADDEMGDECTSDIDVFEWWEMVEMQAATVDSSDGEEAGSETTEGEADHVEDIDAAVGEEGATEDDADAEGDATLQFDDSTSSSGYEADYPDTASEHEYPPPPQPCMECAREHMERLSALVDESSEEESVSGLSPPESDSSLSDGDSDEVSNGHFDGDFADEESDQDWSPHLLLVTAVIKDEQGCITDLTVTWLCHELDRTEAVNNEYRLFGTEISRHPKAEDITDTFSIRVVVSANNCHSCEFIIKPNGDTVRQARYGHACPADCNEGYLPDQAALQSKVLEHLPPLSQYRPVCPVCVGKNFTDEHTALITQLQGFGMVDLTTVIDFLGRLNPRRATLGYQYIQFDERQWGYMFDDMFDNDAGDVSDDDSDDGNDDGDDGWQQLSAEALDPNAGAAYQGASRAARDALARKIYAKPDSIKEGQAESCAICGDAFIDGVTTVIELPCGHKYCPDSCILPWLKTSNSCPECRAKIPEVEGGEVSEEDDDADEDGDEDEEDTRVASGAAWDDFATGPALNNPVQDLGW